MHRHHGRTVQNAHNLHTATRRSGRDADVRFPFSCTLFTIRFTSSKFIFLRISVIVSGLVDWIPISSWISPGRMDAISSISSSFNRSAATSKWKFVFPLCSFQYVQIAMEWLCWLKVRSTNFTCGTSWSMKNWSSFLTSSRFRKRRHLSIEERQ